MSDVQNWQQWLEDNAELLIMLNAYEITPATVIAMRDRLLVAGKPVDTVLFANILELATARQEKYWDKLPRETL